MAQSTWCGNPAESFLMKTTPTALQDTSAKSRNSLKSYGNIKIEELPRLFFKLLKQPSTSAIHTNFFLFLYSQIIQRCFKVCKSPHKSPIVRRCSQEGPQLLHLFRIGVLLILSIQIGFVSTQIWLIRIK